MLDPHPTNHLGKGILTADQESKLLAAGITYARRFTYQDERGKTAIAMMTSRRPIADVYRNVILRKPSVSTRTRRATRPAVTS